MNPLRTGLAGAVAVLLLALGNATPARAASFHLDPVNGSDADGDGSAARPWRTLAHLFDAGLIETRDWPARPYEPGMTLVTINPGAPVQAGDTLWLHAGDHGDLEIRRAYNTAPITLAAVPGEQVRARTLVLHSAQHWSIRGLMLSPSFGGNNAATTIVSVARHNWFGPTWDIDLADLEIESIDDAAAWGPDEWVNLASNGVSISGDRVSLVDSRIRNVRFGVSVSGTHALVRGNLIDGFSADGLRGLGDHGVFEYNRVQNNLIGGEFDANHDDGFQSWSVGEGGVGTGEVVGVVLRGNVFINATDPDNPLRSSMQGIGCFDGFFTDWVVENNVVITDHWHGISFYGMRNSRIVNNTVIDLSTGTPGPPWIRVTDHKDGRRSSNVVVRNNLAASFSLDGDELSIDHNLSFNTAEAAALFIAAPMDLHLRADSPAIDVGSATFAPSHDADRVPRPQGAGFDLGAYEYAAHYLFQDGFEMLP